MNFNTLYLPFRKHEILPACLLSVAYLAAAILLGTAHYWIFCLVALAVLAALAYFLRDFFRETFVNLTLMGKRIWLKPILIFFINLVVCTVVNDIALMYNLPYFVASSWGPLLYDIRAAFLAEQNAFLLFALVTVLVLPVMEELIFRQTIFTLVYPRSRFLATLLSVGLFTAFHVLPFIGTMDTTYLALYGFQFIPTGIFLCYLYTAQDSIASPILMHMLINASVIRTAMGYMVQ